MSASTNTYQSRQELVSIKLGENNVSSQRTSSELYSMLKTQLRTSHTGTLIAFYTQNNEIFIYNTKEQQSVHKIKDVGT